MSKEIAKIEKSFILPILSESESEDMSEEMEGLEINFDRVKIPSGGSTAFEVPGDDPESPDIEKAITGVIVDKHAVNAYWVSSFDGNNVAPDCSSMDGKVGTGNPGCYCKDCEFNQYGSGENGKGKACKNMFRIYILRSGEMFPILITLSPASLRPFSDYMAKRILTKGHKSYGVLTKITLKKALSSGGITYSQAQFTLLETLTPDEIIKMKYFSENIKKISRKFEINEADNEEKTPEDTDQVSNETPF